MARENYLIPQPIFTATMWGQGFLGTKINPQHNDLEDRAMQMDEAHIKKIAAMLKTMAHPIRLKILCLLERQEMTVGEIQEQVKTTHANVSQHLTILRNQGIVSFRKDANFIFNQIEDPKITKLISTMRQLFCQEESYNRKE